MRKKRQEEKPQETVEKVLDVNASMQGTLRFDDPVNLRINGKFEGTLDTKGMLQIGQKADITANITGESISIAGRVSGNIKAVKSLELEGNAWLNGDVETPKLAVTEGAILNGRIQMTDIGSDFSSRGDWMTISELADYLEVDKVKVNEWANSRKLPGTKEEGGEWVFEKTKVDQWIAEGKVDA